MKPNKTNLIFLPWLGFTGAQKTMTVNRHSSSQWLKQEQKKNTSFPARHRCSCTHTSLAQNHCSVCKVIHSVAGACQNKSCMLKSASHFSKFKKIKVYKQKITIFSTIHPHFLACPELSSCCMLTDARPRSLQNLLIKGQSFELWNHPNVIVWNILKAKWKIASWIRLRKGRGQLPSHTHYSLGEVTDISCSHRNAQIHPFERRLK